jgi:hypothetical protein
VQAAEMRPEAAAEMGRSAAARILALCANERVLADRAAHYEQVSGERVAAESGGAFVPDRRVFMIASGASPGREVRERLAAPLQLDHTLEYACAWTKSAGAVHAFSTPEAVMLAYAPADSGPIVVSERALDVLLARGLVASERDGETLRAHSTRDCLAALACVLPDRGAVIPEALSEIAGLPAPALPGDGTQVTPGAPKSTGDNAAALRRELDAIHASRGWRWLQRVYGVLHVLKGRGPRL